MNKPTNEQIKGWMNERTNGRMDGWMDGWIGGWIKNEWKNEWMNERTNTRTHERLSNERKNDCVNEQKTDKRKNAVAVISSWKKYYQTMVNTLARLFYLRHPSDMMVILVFQNILYHTYRTTLAFLVSSHSENFSLLLVHLKNRGLFHRDTSSTL